MKIFVAVNCYANEGEQVVGAYSTLERAKAAFSPRRSSQDSHYEWNAVIELTVDETPEQPIKDAWTTYGK